MDGCLSSSQIVCLSEGIMRIKHDTLVVKWSFAGVEGLSPLFVEVLLTARLHIVPENGDVKVPIWS